MKVRTWWLTNQVMSSSKMTPLPWLFLTRWFRWSVAGAWNQPAKPARRALLVCVLAARPWSIAAQPVKKKTGPRGRTRRNASTWRTIKNIKCQFRIVKFAWLPGVTIDKVFSSFLYVLLYVFRIGHECIDRLFLSFFVRTNLYVGELHSQIAVEPFKSFSLNCEDFCEICLYFSF